MLPASAPAPPDVAAAANAASARVSHVRLDVRWYSTVTSTMDIAGEAAQGGAAEGLVIASEEQTRGRGRRGREWSSPPGAGLYLTFVLRPALDEAASSTLSLLTLAVGVAVRGAIITATGFHPELKWPNDVMVEHRKLAGILSEGFGIGTPQQTVLVGIGINVRAASHPGDVAIRATSLEGELGRPVERAPLLEQVLVAVPTAYDQLRRGNVDDILQAWREAAPSAFGRGVEWRNAMEVRRGRTAGIDQTGALLVQTADGVERVVGGELTWM